MSEASISVGRREAPVLGIDLGTTMSTAAAVDCAGRLLTIPNERGEVTTPSAVFLGGDAAARLQPIVGHDAIDRGIDQPELFADCFKRDMGEAHYRREVCRNRVPPEILSAIVLDQLRRDAEVHVGPVKDAVIAVPAFFNQKLRQATEAAARLAGLNVLGLINEPTAAALASGFDVDASPEQERRVLVYDLGGGTFDVTVLHIQGRRFHTLATDGLVRLGGRDFDLQLAEYLADRFRQRHGVDPRSTASGLQRLLVVAQEVKHQLSETRSEAEARTAKVQFAGLHLGIDVTRREFEDLIRTRVQTTCQTCKDALTEARLGFHDIDCVLMVGGSCRIPLVSRELEQAAGRRPEMPPAPEALVARGAAIFAATRAQSGVVDARGEIEIVNVNSHSLGIRSIDEQKRKVNRILIPRNSALPVEKRYPCVTEKDGQRAVTVHLLEGESENPLFCSYVGKVEVPVTDALPRGTPVELSCRYDTNGIISVTARLPKQKEWREVRFDRAGARDLEPLAVWLRRLLAGEEPQRASQAEAVATGSTGEVVDDQLLARLQRLDDLYRELGRAGAGHPVPAGALASQQTLGKIQRDLHRAQRTLQAIERAMDRTQDAELRLQHGAHAARVRTELADLEACGRHLEVCVGREWLAAGAYPPSAAACADEITRALEQLEAEAAAV